MVSFWKDKNEIQLQKRGYSREVDPHSTNHVKKMERNLLRVFQRRTNIGEDNGLVGVQEGDQLKMERGFRPLEQPCSCVTLGKALYKIRLLIHKEEIATGNTTL